MKKMKKAMVITIIAFVVIVMMALFGFQFAPHSAIQVPPGMAGTELYVCPAASDFWDGIAQSLAPLTRYIRIGFFIAALLLVFAWAWALYQNLLEDKFIRKSFSIPWKFTKYTVWLAVLAVLLIKTPNHFRTVHIEGVSGNWVLCENNTPNAKPIEAARIKS